MEKVKEMEKVDEKIESGDVFSSVYTMNEQGGGIYSPVPKAVLKRKAKSLWGNDDAWKVYLLTHKVEACYDDFSELDFANTFVQKSVSELERETRRGNQVDQVYERVLEEIANLDDVTLEMVTDKLENFWKVLDKNNISEEDT